MTHVPDWSPRRGVWVPVDLDADADPVDGPRHRPERGPAPRRGVLRRLGAWLIRRPAGAAAKPGNPGKHRAGTAAAPAPAPTDADRLAGSLRTWSAGPVESALDTGIVPSETLLSAAELVVLLGEVADQPALWEELVGFDRSVERELVLFCDAHVEVVLVRWAAGSEPSRNVSRWHDHDRSASAVRVILGGLVENTLALVSGDRVALVPSGSVYPFEAKHIHRLEASIAGTISLHAFSPPLGRTGDYHVDSRGLLRRTSVVGVPCGHER